MKMLSKILCSCFALLVVNASVTNVAFSEGSINMFHQVRSEAEDLRNEPINRQNMLLEEQYLRDVKMYQVNSKQYLLDNEKEHRQIDKETDVLSFPMFEKEELEKRNSLIKDVLGDVVISIDRVKEQAIEYGHSFERELAYMVVHGFYHLMGYDHMEENDKILMRQKEENVLGRLKILKPKGE